MCWGRSGAQSTWGHGGHATGVGFILSTQSLLRRTVMDMIDIRNKQVKHSLLWRWLMENRL